eukprot:TRINITY_DN24106_c0_g3_i1.p1 TRINITY_DN24106_c0_g3~~TRINITY_DN24106_c0_g3_i1.p1  ORF type:complete len:299 (+),score=55.25 TRINITY_DN24106_c0_g3_i1:145-1041(+)
MLDWCNERAANLHEYAFHTEGEPLRKHLGQVHDAMLAAIARGLARTGVLPGSIQLRRRARGTWLRAKHANRPRVAVVAYALAVSEENAEASTEVVTAPTCGSCGILPAVLRYLKEQDPSLTRDDLVNALGTAGLVGNVFKTNASISGAEVGCQGEVGVACAMAAAAATELQGGTVAQVERAAEAAIEHNLGLTCDPVDGLVQVPCIERNGLAATRALDCADLALMSDGRHLVSLDEAVVTMKMTGEDMRESYRETARAGLAITFGLDEAVRATPCANCGQPQRDSKGRVRSCSFQEVF